MGATLHGAGAANPHELWPVIGSNEEGDDNG
jgi:hypothetical protein